MANWMIWIAVALVVTMSQASEFYEHFKVQPKEVISIETLMSKLSEPLETPSPKGGIKGLLRMGKAKMGQPVADLLSATMDKTSQVIEGFSVENLLGLNEFVESSCEEDEKRQLNETCMKFCTEQEAKRDGPPTTSDYAHLNLGKYCWGIVQGIEARCTEWRTMAIAFGYN